MTNRCCDHCGAESDRLSSNSDGDALLCPACLRNDPEAADPQTQQTERDGQLALLRQRNAELLAENTKLRRLVNTQRLVIDAIGNSVAQ